MDQSEGQLKTLVWQRNCVSNTKTDKLYKKFKYFGLETDKDNFKVAKMHLEKMMLTKRNS